MKTAAAFATVAVAVLLLGDLTGAYSLEGRRWPAGTTVVMHLELGAAGTQLIDGSPDWDSVAESALAAWNPFLKTVVLSGRRDDAAIASGNRINTVSFGDDVFGDPFGSGVLAVTQSFYTPRTGTITETDVVFNRARNWNSYRGSQRSAAGGGTLIDLRRVALHEFGHAIGLDHPDDHGQSVVAVMNSRVSNVDNLQADDIDGATAIYGADTVPATPSTGSNRAPTVTATCNPCTIEIGTTAQLIATATDSDGDALSYQWTTAAQGSLSSAAAARPTWTAPLAPATIVATVSVSDGRGGSVSSSVTLQVVLRDKLPAGARLVSGQSLISLDGRYRLAYQGDGNLVLYDEVAHAAPWSSGTAGMSTGQVVMQTDGNFVLYDGLNRPRWMSGTPSYASTRLVLQTDGNLVVYTPDGQAPWDRFSSPAGFVP
ncbi:MAG TPA: matrixin family metalloprotease [Vicinamibacterales bacterium]